MLYSFDHQEAKLKESTSDQTQIIRQWTLAVVRVIILLAGIIVIGLIIYRLKTILLLLITCIFFCYLIVPIVHLFEKPINIGKKKFKLQRGPAIGVVYLIFGAILFFSLKILLPLLGHQIRELAGNLPNYLQGSVDAFQKRLDDANSWIRHLNLPVDWKSYAVQQAKDISEKLLPWVKDYILPPIFNLFTYVPWLFLVPILSFFMLKDVSRFEKQLVDLMPTERLQKRTRWLLLDISNTLAAYIRAQITSCIVVGIMATICLLVLGVPYPLVLGVIAGVLEFIPTVGPITAAIIVIGLTMTSSIKLGLVVGIFLIVMRIVQDYVIYPRIIGHGIKMHPLLVILAILCGAEIGGVIGIFLAIPVIGLLIVGFNHYMAFKGPLYNAVSAAVAFSPSGGEGGDGSTENNHESEEG